MPKKIRELKAMLLKVGCVCEQGKGSHTKWNHYLLDYKITISGQARMRQSVARRDLPPSEAAMEVMLNATKRKT